MKHAPTLGRTSLVLCLGEQPNADGTIHQEMMDRVNIAFAKCQSNAVLIFSGGVTRENTISEAEMAKQYFLKTSGSQKGPTIFLEEQSKSTEENFLFTAKLLAEKDIATNNIMVVGRRSQLRKASVYAKRAWPNARIDYVAGMDTKSWLYQFLDQTVGWVLAYLGKEAVAKNFVRNALAQN